MSLTNEDLIQIRQVVEGVFDRKIEPIASEIKALRNDIKELYDMIANMERRSVVIDKAFQKLPVKEQILKLNANLIALAKKEGISLPR